MDAPTVVKGFLHLPSAVIALIQPSLSPVDREVEFWSSHELIVLHILGMIFFSNLFLIFCEENSQFV